MFDRFMVINIMLLSRTRLVNFILFIYFVRICRSFFFFFFSSRRRHTRFDCDWSSDVCSSDLTGLAPHRPSPLANELVQGRHRNPPASSRFRTCAVWQATASAREKHAPLPRSEEHTSELQSQSNLVCRLLLEKKKKKSNSHIT